MRPIVRTPPTQYCRFPAQQFQQGRRTVYSFVMTAGEVDGILPERVGGDLLREADRHLTLSHVREIQGYLQTNPDSWILGSMMLGAAPDAVEFTPYKNENGVDHPTLGELAIRLDRLGTLRIFDGQHRRMALHEVWRSSGTEETNPLHNASLSILLYVENDIGALRQMFKDASQAKPIEKNMVAQPDFQDPYNVAAQYLIDESLLFNSGVVELEKSSVDPLDFRLLAIDQLVRILKTLEMGYGSRVSQKRMAEVAQDQATLNEDCLAWSDEFLAAARREFEWLALDEYTGSDLPRLRRETYAVNVTFLRILAGSFYLWMQNEVDWYPLAEWIREANLEVKPSSKNKSILHRTGLVQQRGGLSERKEDIQRAISFIVQEATEAINLTKQRQSNRNPGAPSGERNTSLAPEAQTVEGLSPEDAAIPLSDFDPRSRALPMYIICPDGSWHSIGRWWRGIPRQVFKWLMDNGRIQDHDIPVRDEKGQVILDREPLTERYRYKAYSIPVGPYWLYTEGNKEATYYSALQLFNRFGQDLPPFRLSDTFPESPSDELMT